MSRQDPTPATLLVWWQQWDDHSIGLQQGHHHEKRYFVHLYTLLKLAADEKKPLPTVREQSSRLVAESALKELVL